MMLRTWRSCILHARMRMHVHVCTGRVAPCLGRLSLQLGLAPLSFLSVGCDWVGPTLASFSPPFWASWHNAKGTGGAEKCPVRNGHFSHLVL